MAVIEVLDMRPSAHFLFAVGEAYLAICFSALVGKEPSECR